MEQVKGQAVTEYVLMLAIVVMLFTAFVKYFENGDAYQSLVKPLTVDFKNAYQYGHPQANGQKNIAQDPENLRVFMNPPINK